MMPMVEPKAVDIPEQAFGSAQLFAQTATYRGIF
jgi:hypothetical protein